jgi:hypothetical protein
MTLITPPPPAPNRSDPATFPDRADAYVAWWAQVASELNGFEVYGRSNVVGNVGQSGGVPTGAVIQRGSTSNGQFTRWADGTQMCFHTITTSGGTATWTFPVAFSSQPVAAMTPTSTQSRIVTTAPPTVTDVLIRGWDGSSVSDVTVRAIAIGRWF